MHTPITVLMNGAFGNMGQACVKAIEADSELQLIASLGRADDLRAELQALKPQVTIDFTTPAVAYNNACTIIDQGSSPVIGTTGFTADQITELQTLAAKQSLGGIIAPNFSIGAVLMMHMAQQAAKYLPQAEIIELHHPQKKDAPSGTAIKTAEMISKARNTSIPRPTSRSACQELIPGALGALKDHTPIHAIRLPGFLAHQQVIFGGHGESLTLRHDTLNRECFMPGVVLACKKVASLNQLYYGLEHLLKLEE